MRRASKLRQGKTPTSGRRNSRRDVEVYDDDDNGHAYEDDYSDENSYYDEDESGDYNDDYNEDDGDSGRYNQEKEYDEDDRYDEEQYSNSDDYDENDDEDTKADSRSSLRQGRQTSSLSTMFNSMFTSFAEQAVEYLRDNPRASAKDLIEYLGGQYVQDSSQSNGSSRSFGSNGFRKGTRGSGGGKPQCKHQVSGRNCRNTMSSNAREGYCKKHADIKLNEVPFKRGARGTRQTNNSRARNSTSSKRSLGRPSPRNTSKTSSNRSNTKLGGRRSSGLNRGGSLLRRGKSNKRNRESSDTSSEGRSGSNKTKSNKFSERLKGNRSRKRNDTDEVFSPGRESERYDETNDRRRNKNDVESESPKSKTTLRRDRRRKLGNVSKTSSSRSGLRRSKDTPIDTDKASKRKYIPTRKGKKRDDAELLSELAGEGQVDESTNYHDDSTDLDHEDSTDLDHEDSTDLDESSDHEDNTDLDESSDHEDSQTKETNTRDVYSDEDKEDDYDEDEHISYSEEVSEHEE